MGSEPRNDRHDDGKIFIGGLPKDTTFEQFNEHFGQYGEMIDSVIMKDRQTGQPRGFGFVTYADSSVVDNVIEDTHIINGKMVEIKKAEPRKYSHPPPGHAFSMDSRGQSFRDSYSESGGPYDSYDGGYGPGPSNGVPYGRYAGGYGYPGDYMNGYGIGGYPSHFAIYDVGFAANYIYSTSGQGGYDCGGDGHGIYRRSGYVGDYVSGNIPSVLYGRGGYGSSSRYHPYAR